MSGLCLQCSLIVTSLIRNREDTEPAAVLQAWSQDHTVAACLKRLQRSPCIICESILSRWPTEQPRDGAMITAFTNKMLHSHEQSFPCEIKVHPWSLPSPLYFTILNSGRLASQSPAVTTKSAASVTEITRKRPRNTGDSEVLDCAREWVHDCLQSRATAQAANSSYESVASPLLPRRLLQIVDDNSRVFLLESSEIPSGSEYTTLSNRWGQAQHLLLSKANETHLRNGVDLDDLPRTFRDAVRVTRTLGVRFLWIDALCIIQDAPEDWAEQSAKMKQIYQNSFCNIAASDTEDDQGGLFFERDPWKSQPREWTYQSHKSGNDTDAAVALTIVQESRDWNKNIEYSPLYRRAWVFQERLLSPRTLHWTKFGPLFECNYGQAISETSLYFDGQFYDSDGQNQPLLEIRRLFDTEDPPHSPDALYPIWNAVVEAYTRCALTFPKDTLVAISSVVDSFRNLIDGQYQAGMWERFMPWCLLWSNLVGDYHDEYVAPSWSWASLEGPMGISNDFAYGKHDDFKVNNSGEERSAKLAGLRGAVLRPEAEGYRFGSPLSVGMKPCADIQNIYLRPRHANSAEISFGSMRITGPLTVAKFPGDVHKWRLFSSMNFLEQQKDRPLKDAFSMKQTVRRYLKRMFAPTIPGFLWCLPDAVGHSGYNMDGTIYCLVIGREDIHQGPYHKFRVCGLTLEKVGETLYRRHGVWEAYFPDPFGHAKRTKNVVRASLSRAIDKARSLVGRETSPAPRFVASGSTIRSSSTVSSEPSQDEIGNASLSNKLLDRLRGKFKMPPSPKQIRAAKSQGMIEALEEHEIVII